MPKSKHNLAIFSAGAFTPEQKDGKATLPTSLLVLPWGANDTSYGKVIVNEHTLSVLSANQQLFKHPRVALDFNHNSVESAPSYKGEPVKIACFGAPRVVPGEGIYLDIDPATWTPEGKDHVLNGHYPELSAAVKRNAKGEVVFLHSAALARQGDIKGLTTLSVNLDTIDLMKDISNLDPNAVRATANVFLSAMKLAPIPDDAQPDAVLSALEGGLAKITELQAGPSTKEPDGDEKSVTTLSARLDSLERRHLVERASREGKVIPLADADLAKLDLITLSAMIDKLPVTLDVDKRPGVDAALSAKTSDCGMTDSLRTTLQGMGLTEEDFKKYGPKNA